MGPLSRPLIRSGQWSQTTAGILQPAARLCVAESLGGFRYVCPLAHQFSIGTEP